MAVVYIWTFYCSKEYFYVTHMSAHECTLDVCSLPRSHVDSDTLSHSWRRYILTLSRQALQEIEYHVLFDHNYSVPTLKTKI